MSFVPVCGEDWREPPQLALSLALDPLGMALEIPLTFTRFGWSSLEERASSIGFSVDQCVEQACAYYLSELDRGRAAARLPRFAAECPDGTARVLTLELDERSSARLEREAHGQDSSLASLLRHAAFLYLADLDAGRVAERVTGRAQAQ